MDWQAINAEVIAEFRSRGGRVARFGDLPVVILHTQPAGAGAPREIPLIVVPEGSRDLLFATAAGAKADPGWVADLRAQSRIEVERGEERFMADVLELPVSEAEAHVAQQVERTSQFAEYARKAAPRRIPVFEIVRL